MIRTTKLIFAIYVIRLVFGSLAILGVAGLLLSCNPKDGPLFTPVSGLDFVNAIPENDSVNILLFEYIYNGGGVGVGDFDRDGNPDLVFSGNYVSSRLYLQQSDWKFTDVTVPSGLTTEVWCAGVNVADVDGNGWDDIYFATLNPTGENDVPNLLFLNLGTNDAGVPVFREAALEFGLADRGYSTHSAWFDLENDGDLDLYVLNNAIENYNRNVAKGTDTLGKGKSLDRIYRRERNEVLTFDLEQPNDGPSTATMPAFQPTDLIQTEGWGLGITVQDFNMDNRADIYVANDFLSNDFMLINQGDSTFRDELRQRIPHQSRNAMGVDVADLTGDGQPEIMVVDMLPDDNSRVKTMFGDVPHRGAEMEIQRGYARQYVRNTLQLNNGDGTFSDIAFQAGVAATDWSWAPLLEDVDNDGLRDIYISNGYPKDITNKDFIDFNDKAGTFGTSERKIARVVEALRDVDGVHQPSFLFRNEGNLSFSQTSWLPESPTYSNGSVLVDLDGDGDLDLVTNNINEPAGIFRSNLRERSPDSSNFFQLDLEGPPGNPDALGAKVWVKVGGKTMYHEHYRQRGYLSTTDQTIHFGLGTAVEISELLVRFPDGTGVQQFKLPGNQRMSLAWSAALQPVIAPASAPKKSTLKAEPLTGPVHYESAYSDFNVQALALRDHSRGGPAMAAIDIEQDGIDELIFGGSAGEPITVWRQDGKGGLEMIQRVNYYSDLEPTAIAVFPKQTAGIQQVYVATGSTEAGNDLNHRLFDLNFYANASLNMDSIQGIADNATPPRNASVVVSNGKKSNEDIWVFVGNRMSTTTYLKPAPSVVLRISEGNETGILKAAQSLDLGMVTDAVAADFDGDGLVDLAVAGDYADLKILPGEKGKIGTPVAIPNTAGWHYSLTATDLDEDGDTDLLLGNVGLNTPYRVSPERPLVLLADDYDNNGSVDPVITAYNGQQAYPVLPRNTLTRQLPGWKKMLQSYALYGNWTADDLPPMSAAGLRLEAVEFRSLYLENDGKGNFTMRPLPALAQTAPVRDALNVHLTDGRRALLCVQNDYATEPLGGRFDAGTGFALALDKDGQLEVLSNYVSLPVDARSIVRLRNETADGMILVGVNNGPVLSLSER